MSGITKVRVAGAYSVFFWINAIIWTVILAALTMGVGLLLFPILLWRKIAVINRTGIDYSDDAKSFTFYRGRWFVRDDDTIPVKSIDNVKINRSLSGKIFGWCDVLVETRAEAYKIAHVTTRNAERFRQAFLAQV